MENSIRIANNFISSLDNGEECVMHSKSDNIEIMINDKAHGITEELFASLKNRYQNNWKGIHFPSKKDYWKNFEKNNVTINLNALCAEKK